MPIFTCYATAMASSVLSFFFLRMTLSSQHRDPQREGQGLRDGKAPKSRRDLAGEGACLKEGMLISQWSHRWKGQVLPKAEGAFTGRVRTMKAPSDCHRITV